MANKIYNFLPAHLRNNELESIFDATLERAFSKGNMRKEKAFVGRKEKGIYSDNDVYLSFPEHLFQRDNYGLEPVFSNTAIGDNVYYEDLLNAMFNKGMLTNDHKRLFETKTEVVNLPIDADKFVNWSMYYWVKPGFFADDDDRQESDNKHYVTIDKASAHTWWGKNNAWYHYDDIRGSITSDNKWLIEQAKRPIIEFDSRLNVVNEGDQVTSWELPIFFCSDDNDYNIFKYVTSDLHPYDPELGMSPKLSANDYNSEYTFIIDLPVGVDFDIFETDTPFYTECKFNYRNLRHEFGNSTFSQVELSQDANSQNDIDVYIDGIKQIGNYTYDDLIVTFDPALTGDLYVDYMTRDNVTVDGDNIWQRINPAIEYNVDNEYHQNREMTYTTLYEHFVRIIETTDGLTGEPNGVNNFRHLGDNVDKLRFNHLGSVLVRNTVDIKKAYFSITRDDYDPVKATEFLSTSFSNFKNKLVTTIHSILNENGSETKTTTEILEQVISEISLVKRSSISAFDGLAMINLGENLSHYTEHDVDTSIGSRFQPIPNELLTEISESKNLSVYLNGVLQKNIIDYVLDSTEIVFSEYVVSNDDSINIRYYHAVAETFIPPSSTKLGINELYVPRRITDTEYETDIEMIVGHDGSVVPAWGDKTDDILLEFETLVFNRLIEERTDTDIKRFGYGIYRDASDDYSVAEKKYVQYPFFKKWMIRNNIDNLYNDTFDASDWKTWNYRSLNELVPGNWRGIMQYVYGTDNPIAEPWVTVGLSRKPDGFDVYGIDYTSIDFWNNIKAAYNKDWPVPVDTSGNIETISNLFYGGNISNSDILIMDQDWEFGDGSPVEMAWRRSSEYTFAQFLLMILTKPFEVLNDYADQIDNIISIQHQVDGHSTNAITSQRDSYEFKLGSKLGGFVNNFKLLSENSGLSNSRFTDIPRDNYNLFVHAGEPNRSESFSAIVIEKVSIDKSYPTYDLNATSSYEAGDIILNPYDKKYYKRKSSIESDKEITNAIKFDYSNWTLISQPQPREFGYRVHGYDDFNTVFFTMDWDKTSGEKIWTTAGDEANLNVWTSNEYFRQDSYVVYNNVPYVSLISHTSSTTFDNDVQNWKILAEWPRINQTEARGYKETLVDQIKTHSYGDILTSIDDVAQLMVGYQAYLKAIGWDFTDTDDDNKVVDFETLLEKFLDWSTEVHQPGDFITLTPVLFSGSFDTPYGVATIGRDTNKNFYRVVDESGRQIPTTEIEFNSANGKITWESKIPIYGIKLDVADIEQAFVVDRVDSYGDVIYDPFSHNRNLRMIVDCNRTIDWNGTLAADGYIVSNDTLIPNLETMVADTQFYRDTLVDQSLANINNLKANQIGYSPRMYLSNHGVERETQLEFYKGFLAGKSTVSSINRIINANSNFEDIKHKDMWAIKLADYGKLDNNNYSEQEINTIDIVSDPHIVKFANYNNIPNIETQKTVAIKNSGYVDTQDVNYTVSNKALLNSSISSYYEGDLAWVQFDEDRDWDVLRLSEIAEINYIKESEDGQLIVGLTNEINTSDASYLKIINSDVDPEIQGNYYFVKEDEITSDGLTTYEYIVFDTSFEPLIVEVDSSTSNSTFVPSTSAIGIEAIGYISNPVFSDNDTLVINGEVFEFDHDGTTTLLSDISIGRENLVVDPIVTAGDKVRVVVYDTNGFIANTNTLVTFSGTSALANSTVTSNDGDEFTINGETITVQFASTQSIRTESDATETSRLTTGSTLILASGSGASEESETVTVTDIEIVGTAVNPTIPETKSIRVDGVEIKFTVDPTPTNKNETFVATAAQTDFVLSETLSAETWGIVSVTIDAVATTNFTVSGQTVTITDPVLAGSESVVIALTHEAIVMETSTIISTINGTGLGISAALNSNNNIVLTTSAESLTLTGGALTDLGLSTNITESKLNLLSNDIDALTFVSGFINNGHLVITTDNDDLRISGSAFNQISFPSNTYEATSSPTAVSIVNQINALRIPNITADVVSSRVNIRSTGTSVTVAQGSAGSMSRLGYASTSITVNSIDSIVADLNTALADITDTNAVVNDRSVLITSGQSSIVLSNILGDAWGDIGINTGVYSNTSTVSSTAAKFRDQINQATTDIAVSLSSDGRMIFTSDDNTMTFSGTSTTMLETIGLVREYSSVTSSADFKVMRWKSVRFTPNFNGEDFDEFYSKLGINEDTKLWADDYQSAGWAVLQRDIAGILSVTNRRATPINTDYVDRIIAKTGDDFYNYQLFDPLNLKMPGSIVKDIDYVSWDDPAKYDIVVNSGLWLEQNLGDIWWDTTEARYYRYDDYGDENGNADVTYAKRFWGKLIPGSVVSVKQWIKSETLPSDVIDYNTEVYFDSVRNKSIRNFYYWTTIGSEARYYKEYSISEIAMMIESPSTVNRFFPITATDIILSNNSNILSGDTVTYKIEYRNTNNRETHHTDWSLVSRRSNTPLSDVMLDDLKKSVGDSNIENYSQFEIATEVDGYTFSYDWIGDNSLTVDDIVVTINNRIVNNSDFYINYNAVIINNSIKLLPGDVVRVYHVTQYDSWFTDITSARNNFASVISSVLDSRMFVGKFPLYTDYVALNHGIFDTSNWYYSDDFKDITSYEYLSSSRDIDMIKLQRQRGINSFKIELAGEGNEYYATVDGEIRLVHKENAVLNLDFSVTELTVQDSVRLTQAQVAVQIHELFNMLYLYADTNEIKSIFFDMIEYMYTEKTYPDWIFKTSYIDLTLFNKPLRQYAIYQRDSYQDTIDYITETKPYHTKIREVERIYPTADTIASSVEALHHMHITKYFGNHSRFALNGIDGGTSTAFDKTGVTTTWEAHDADIIDSGESQQDVIDGYDLLAVGTYQGGKFLRNDIEYTSDAGGFDTGPFSAQVRDASVVAVNTFTDEERITLVNKEFFVYDRFGRGYQIPVTFTGTISNFDGDTVTVNQSSKFRAAKAASVQLIAIEDSNGNVEFMTYNKKASTNLTIADRGLFTGLSTGFANGDIIYVLGLLDSLTITG